MYAVAKEIDRLGIAVCCLQEVRYRNNNKRTISLPSGAEYDFIWSGPKRRRDNGVGYLVKVDKNIEAEEPDTQDPRVIAMNINVYGFKMRLVNAYSPTNTDGSSCQKDDFYRKVRKACVSTSKNHKLIVAGDFNAITSVVLKNSYFNSTSIIEDLVCNDNGSRLKQFCRSNKLSMIQTYFDVDISKRYTWFSNDGKTKRVLDYILSENFITQFVSKCAVESDCKIESDHRLIVTEFETPCTKKARWKKRILKEKSRNLKELERKEVKELFVKELTGKMPITDKHEPIKLKSERIVTALKDSAQLSIPAKTNKCNHEIWKHDELLNKYLEERANLERGTTLYKDISKKIKKRVGWLRNEKLKMEAEELNKFANKRQIENLFRKFKDDNHAFKSSSTSKEKCDPAMLKQYFRDHFKSSDQVTEPKELHHLPEFVKKLQKTCNKDMNILPPNSDEIKKCLNKLKNRKAANDVPTELLKTAGENKEFLEELTSLYNHVWIHHEIPEEWGHSKLVALWKGPSKGKSDDPSTYRGLQIGSTLCKLFVTIILARISTWYEAQLLDQQQGFRTGRGTTDGIFIAKTLHQIAKRSGKEMYILFVDLTSAFDHIDRRWLFKTIKQRLQNKLDCKLFDLLELLYSSTTTALAGNELDKFIIELGVRQGGAESPLLFNLYIDYVMRVFLSECTTNKVHFLKLKYEIPNAAFVSNSSLGEYGKNVLNWIGYADDLVLAFENIENLNRGLKILNGVFKRFGLTMNVGKTKTMIFNYLGTSDEYPKSIAAVNEEEVKNVKEFRYLGSQFHYDQPGTGEIEITSRKDAAESKFYEHGKKFMNYRINLAVRTSILNSLVRSRLTYGCQTWMLTTAQMKHIDSCYVSMLRKMVRGGYKRKEGEWAYKITNEQLIKMCKTESVSDFVKRQRKRYLAHVIRLPNCSTTKRLMFNSDATTIPGNHTSFYQSVLKAEGTNIHQFGTMALEKRI